MVAGAGKDIVQYCCTDITKPYNTGFFPAVPSSVRVVGVPARRRQLTSSWSSFTDRLIVTAIRLFSIGSRAFPVAGLSV